MTHVVYAGDVDDDDDDDDDNEVSAGLFLNIIPSLFLPLTIPQLKRNFAW